MTAGTTFKWMLWPPHEEHAAMSDEFVVVAEGFRIRLMGNTLELSFEGSDTYSHEGATALAEKYIAVLRKHLPAVPLALITEEDFLARTTPPFGTMTTLSPSREGRKRATAALRKARNELLAAADQALRRCYDFLQDAHEQMNAPDGKEAYAVYKAMEVLKQRFRGEAKAEGAIGKGLKKAKKVANDERHIPREGQPKPSGDSVGLAKAVIQQYERYLLGHRRTEKQ